MHAHGNISHAYNICHLGDPGEGGGVVFLSAQERLNDFFVCSRRVEVSLHVADQISMTPWVLNDCSVKEIGFDITCTTTITMVSLSKFTGNEKRS